MRVFELAKEIGVDTKEVLRHAPTLGIPAADHLFDLNRMQADALRKAVKDSPSAGVVEKRVNKTVRRRRSRSTGRQDAAAAPVVARTEAQVVQPPAEQSAPAAEANAPSEATVAPDATSPAATNGSALKSAEAEVPVAVVDASAERSASKVALEAEEAPQTTEAIEPTVEEAVTSSEASSADEQAPTKPAEPESAEPVAEAESTAPAEDTPQSATAAPTEKSSRPTHEKAVVITTAVNRQVLDAVARTRMEKGYDRSAAHDVEPQHRRPAVDEVPNQKPGGDPRGPANSKKRSGRRLVYDKRRDQLHRRGLVDTDNIYMRGSGKKRTKKKRKSAVQVSTVAMKDSKRVVKMGKAITIGDLAQAMMVKSTQVIAKLMGLGMMATINEMIDFDTATMLADEFGWRVESVAFDLTDYVEQVEEDSDELVTRAPVVTIMGHVDHGKTSLLDAIRKSRITAKEAGGITQHIGAYAVDLPKRGRVVFIDTPGHQAFTAMRARGSQATDIVVLVVAADDGVMPQTIESINHARAAEVPIVVAINKMDKEGANPDRVMTELSEHNLVSEAWGGDVQMIRVSAMKGDGLDDLLEALLLQAEILELSASVKKPAEGVVLEGRLERGRGPVATLLVQQGVLKQGDHIVTGVVSGRVRAMTDSYGKRLKEAGPSTPVEVIGLSGVPSSTDRFIRVASDKAAGKIVSHRSEEARAEQQAKQKKVSLDSLREMLDAQQVEELKVIVKSDVHGSGEALKEALEDLSHPEVAVKVIHNAVGGITESDVNLAAASDAMIIGFGVRPEAKGKALAEQQNVSIKLYSVIYDALDDVREAMAGKLAPVEQENYLGRAEIRALFSVPKIGFIAGCYITDGMVTRNSRVRLFRDNQLVYTGSVQSLRRFKNDAKEVASGYECGVGIGYNDIKEDDELEFFEIVEVAATLD
jgi:translation initiation factor IF-2